MVGSRTSRVTSVMVPLVMSSMLNGMGKAMGTSIILYIAIWDRVSMRVVVMVMLLTVKAGPEQKHPGMLLEQTSWRL